MPVQRPAAGRAVVRAGIVEKVSGAKPWGLVKAAGRLALDAVTLWLRAAGGRTHLCCGCPSVVMMGFRSWPFRRFLPPFPLAEAA